jgi:hypothetical protein
MYPAKAPVAELQTKAQPTAVVKRGYWVGDDGNQVAVAGSRARGIAFQNFDQKEVDYNATGSEPKQKLTVIQFGPAKTFLGATVGDNKFVTVDATGRTIEASTANHEILGYIEKGGVVGEEREIFVLRNDQLRVPAAAITIPAAITGGESPTEAEFNALRTVVASMAAALVAHKIVAP